MRVAAVIRAPKTNVRTREWTEGKIPASEFRFRPHQPAKKLGRSWLWRVITFSALGEQFRLLIVFHEPKQMCSLTLGLVHGDLVTVVCIHEYHPNEPGWHCHSVRDCHQGANDWTHRRLRRFPRKPVPGARFGLDRRGATALAVRFFVLGSPGPLL
jgi:hypothetical protein